MKKLAFLTIAVIVLFSAHQVSAVNDNANQHAKDNSQKTEVGDQNNETPTVSSTDDWKNHGQYVKSVAQTHPGGQVVSAAAKSDIGKKGSSTNPSVSPSISPSVSPSVSPTSTPTGTLTPTPTIDQNATPSPTLTTTPTPTESVDEQVQNVITTLENLIATLKNIFHL